MIHHMSFGVREPARVANALAAIVGARAICAPAPPFPHGSWFVVWGDDRGSSLEILPATAVFDPEAPLGVKHRSEVPRLGTGHVLVSSQLEADAICAIAAKENWQVQEVETGLFRILKLWIEGGVLVEVFAKGEADRYVETFGAAGISTLDAKLRALETDLAAGLSERLSPELLSEALDAPPSN